MSKRNLSNRRQFLSNLAVGAAGVHTLAGASVSRAAGPGDQVRMAVLGAGGRGGQIAGSIAKVAQTRVVMTADPDISRAEKLAKKHDATAVADLREAIDNDDVDAVAITTCNHWHCLAAMWAIEAGKDVYVEKPLSHSQWEGRQVVDAARQAGRIVQLGTQQRSDPIQMQARKFLHEQKALGEIKYVQANRLGERGPIGKRDTPLGIPKEVNYDLWLGPAAEQPIFRNNLHYDWHWDWNTGSGEMGNWGVHILDDVRNVAYQDTQSLPTRMIAGGGRLLWDDAGQTPNHHFAMFETDTFPTLIALSNLKADPSKSKSRWDVRGSKAVSAPPSGYAVVCEGGYYLGQRGRGQAVDLEGNVIRAFKADVDTIPAHIENFALAVQSRDEGSLAAPIENGHYSTGWCNLANVAFRVAGPYDGDAIASASDLAAWPELLDNLLGPLGSQGVDLNLLRTSGWLTHDPATERFTGDNAESANQFLRREYRKGYEVKQAAKLEAVTS